MFEVNYEDKIIIYTDGGTRSKVSNGKISKNSKSAFACTLTYHNTKKIIVYSGYGITNNEAELRAIYTALKSIKTKNIPVELYSDSQYSIDCITKWSYGWEKNNWKKKDGSEISNIELIKNILNLSKEFSFLEFKKVKGHSGNEGNEEVDQLLNEAMNCLPEIEIEDENCKFPLNIEEYYD